MRKTLPWSTYVKSHKSCENEKMSCAAEGVRVEMQERVRDVAALAAEDSRKAALVFAARVLGLPFDRVRRLFYGQARRIEAHEADQIRAYCEAATKLIEARADYEKQRREFLAEAHPGVLRLAPRWLVGEKVSEIAERKPD
jgi:hypothetical protein